uniref:Uncharacterized protein n=1 Tax=Nelumbo nucifera TaxID=4432 RepID=A0A822YNH4_NELNU|nr:TPA_asm: hypothetical protein HUJ06_004707 [Nelumbo nucifera]
MSILKEWWGADKGEFPRLIELIIGYFPKLSKLSPLLPSVKRVQIWRCDKLTCLPRFPSAAELDLKKCSGSRLNWMNQCPSLSCLPIGNFEIVSSLPPSTLHGLPSYGISVLEPLYSHNGPILETPFVDNPKATLSKYIFATEVVCCNLKLPELEPLQVSKENFLMMLL